jgi:hypothetical protein
MLPAFCLWHWAFGVQPRALGVHFVPPSINHKSVITSCGLLPPCTPPAREDFWSSLVRRTISFSDVSTLNYQLSTFLSLPMERPEKVAGHDVSDDAKQRQKNRHPENPTVVHASPARSVRMTVVMLVAMVLIVHTKERKHITGTSILGKEKGPSRTGGYTTAQKLAFPYPVKAVEAATGGTLRCLILCSIYRWSSLVQPF